MSDPTKYEVTVNDGVTGLSLPGIGHRLVGGDVVELTPRQFHQIDDQEQLDKITVTREPSLGGGTPVGPYGYTQVGDMNENGYAYFVNPVPMVWQTGMQAGHGDWFLVPADTPLTFEALDAGPVTDTEDNDENLMVLWVGPEGNPGAIPPQEWLSGPQFVPHTSRFVIVPASNSVPAQTLFDIPFQVASDDTGMVNLSTPAAPELVADGLYALALRVAPGVPFAVPNEAFVQVSVFGPAGDTFWQTDAVFYEGREQEGVIVAFTTRLGGGFGLHFRIYNPDLDPVTFEVFLSLSRLAD